MSEVLTRTKVYPSNYPQDAVAILDAMSFTHGKHVKLVGSMSLRSQLYAGDYDAYEVVPPATVSSLVRRFQDIVRDLSRMTNAYVGDIKAGVIDEWDVAGVSRDITASKNKLLRMEREGVITRTERIEAEGKLKNPDTAADIKFHIVRWTPAEVYAGHKKLRDGRDYTLAEAFQSHSIIKLDVVGLIQNNRYTDFSILYELHGPDGHVLNKVDYDIAASLKHDIKKYTKKGEYFKVIKRQFALAKFEGKNNIAARLTPILNSDLGRLYQIVSDIGTLTYLLEHDKGDVKKMKFEIDQFVGRLSNIYHLTDYLKSESDVLGRIRSVLKSPREQMLPRLEALHEELADILNSSTKRLKKPNLSYTNGRSRKQLRSRGLRTMEGGGTVEEA